MAKSNSGPAVKMPSHGSVRGPVSWMGRRPYMPLSVDALTRMTRAGSCRLAYTPVSTLVSPGPVVTNTTTGLPEAMLASHAAKAAPLSCRKWVTSMPVPPSADQKKEIAPPVTLNACRTPSSSSASAKDTANVVISYPSASA